MNHTKNVEHTWDAIAESFNKTRQKPWDICLNFIKNLKPTTTLADIACGNGRHLLPAAQQCKQVIGIDISEKLLHIAQTKTSEYSNVLLLHADARHLPLCDNSVDAVLFIAALHNIPGKTNRINALQEVQRILKPSGIALISVWSRWQDRFRTHFIKQFFIRKPGEEFGDIILTWRQHSLDVPRYYHLYSKREFLDDINQSSLNLKQSHNLYLHSKKYPDNYFAIVQK